MESDRILFLSTFYSKKFGFVFFIYFVLQILGHY